jgi:hypothetical protein
MRAPLEAYDSQERGCAMRHVFLVVLSFLLAGCSGSPTAPAATAVRTEALLATGRWSSGPACLSVTESAADLYFGCWHGQFTRPSVGTDGTFSAEGTYRFEAGPVRDETGQTARFTGSISGETLTLAVDRTDQSIPRSTFAVVLSGSGTCTQLCL